MLVNPGTDPESCVKLVPPSMLRQTPCEEIAPLVLVLTATRIFCPLAATLEIFTPGVVNVRLPATGAKLTPPLLETYNPSRSPPVPASELNRPTARVHDVGVAPIEAQRANRQ